VSSLIDPPAVRIRRRVRVVVPSSGVDLRPIGRRGTVARPSGSYEFYKDFIEQAVRTGAPPSPELIKYNKRLASWEAYLGVAEVSSFPVRFYAAITDLCNARCTFCPYATENATGRHIQLADIERADWLRFVERFDPNSALGEPLIHPQIAEILEAVRRQAPFIKVGITTNASLLSPRVIRTVVGHLSAMTVSLNAARKETYERVMKPLKWDQTLANLTALAAEKKRLGTTLPDVQGSVVVHRHILDELPEVPSVLRSVGIDSMRVLVMTVPKPVESRQLFTQADLIHHEPARANRAFRELVREAERNGVRLVNRPPVLAES
jgi:MoaA/NifB/PqqE/SkfB family radical SAM enzyme